MMDTPQYIASRRWLPAATAGLLVFLVMAVGCAPDERHDSAFYKICKDKNKSAALAHTVQEVLALVSSPASCEQAHNYLMKTSSLTLDGKNITALEPLAGLPELVELNLSGNGIKDVSPLVGMAKLRFLYLENNQLTAVNALAGLPSLAVLKVGHNQLTDLEAFSEFPSLTRLYAEHNTLSYSGLEHGLEHGHGYGPKLIKLNLSHNKALIKLPESLTATLTELNISETGITDLSPLQGSSQLVEFMADNAGGIADLGPLGQKASLAVVSVKGNKVSSVAALASTPALRHLDVSFNQLDSLMPLAESSNLKALFVEGNPIANTKNQTADNCPQGANVPEPIRNICKQPDLEP